MHRLLNFAYLLLLLLAAPVLLYRMIVYGKYREGWKEKFLGLVPFGSRESAYVESATCSPDNEQRTKNKKQHTSPRIWFHAVSVGEVLQLEPVVAGLLNEQPASEVIVTTTTVTGLAVAREKFPQQCVCYFPLDFSWAVNNALNRLCPDVVVLVELELWPNFIRAVYRRGIPLLLINGRISERSFRGYRKLRSLMRPLLGSFHRLAVQNETYAERFRRLGAPPQRITVTGSIKFDRVQTNCGNTGTRQLREAFGIAEDETIFIAGSTHAPEEEVALDVWQALCGEFPRLRLILVPRHKERFDEVARLVESRGLPLLKRSQTGTGKSKVGCQNSENRKRVESSALNPHPSSLNLQRRPVLLLDTLGELAACWGLADIAFVGGSLTNRGGQNMMEPAGYAAAVLLGPNTKNFRDVVDFLQQENAVRVVADKNALAGTLRELLNAPGERRRLGERARRVVLAQQGATARTLSLLTEVLKDGPTGRKTVRLASGGEPERIDITDDASDQDRSAA